MFFRLLHIYDSIIGAIYPSQILFFSFFLLLLPDPKHVKWSVP